MTPEQLKEFVDMRISIQLMEKDVKWTKKKTSDMSTIQNMMAEDVRKMRGLLLKDDQIDSIGYIAVTRNLVKRVNKLENVKKAVLTGLFGLAIFIGWSLKMIWNYITKNES